MSDAPHPPPAPSPVHGSPPVDDHAYYAPRPVAAAPPFEAQEPLAPIAPWWHTVAVLLLLTAWATLSGARHRSYDDGSHVATYISQMMLSWMLFGSVIAGISDRGLFFSRTVGNKLRQWRGDALRGLVVYAGIYGTAVCLALLFGVAGLAWQMTHHASTAPPTSTARTADAPSRTPTTPVPPPPSMATPDPIKQLKALRFDPKTVLALAPRTPFELLLWIGISLTAGFSEEHIFRGYLLKQARAYTTAWGMSPRLTTVLSVVVVALIFGSLHVYEGVGGALMVTFLGIVYGFVAVKLGSLRAVIAAHFLQDFIAGFMLFLFHTFYAKLLG